MNAPSIEVYEKWIDRHVVDFDGHRIGIIADLYLDDASGYPEWLAVMTGLFGTRLSFVPISGAVEAGEKICVSFPRSLIKDSPNVDAEGKLSVEEEQRLYRHYGLRYPLKTVAASSAASTVADTDVSVVQAQRRLRRRDEAALNAIDLRSEDAPLSATNSSDDTTS